MIEFEFDEAKSLSNKQKHGIDFVEAQNLWNDPNLVEIKARTDNEPRYLIIGMVDSKYWSAVTTARSNKVRIISVRRSRKSEVDIYES